MDIKKFQLEHGLQSKDVIAAIRKEFPRYSKITHCMVSNPKMYGVRLVPAAEEILTDLAPRKADKHKNKYRLSCRVTKDRYEAVKRSIENDGRFASVQSFLDWWVFVWLRMQEKGDASNGIHTGGIGGNGSRRR